MIPRPDRAAGDRLRANVTVVGVESSGGQGGSLGLLRLRGGRRLASVKTTSYTFQGLRCGTSYVLGVAARGAKGGVSRRAAIIEATDGCAPPRASGGTLIVNASKDFDFTDPSLRASATRGNSSTRPGSSSTTTRTSRRARAARLVHEAAAGFPLISDGGKTYTITVKPGFKFSDGTPVTAANFAFAINRALQKAMQSPAILFMDGIVGANAVYEGKASTAFGVHVHGDKLVIQLDEPDGGFTAKLAHAVLSGDQDRHADRPERRLGVSVGRPLLHRAQEKGSRVTLKRNPYYAGSRPANADTIQINVGVLPCRAWIRSSRARPTTT